MTEKHYLLQADKNAIERLTLQHTLYEESSQNLLQKANINTASSVLEVGCGIGLMTNFIAKSIAPGGKLTAIDINPDFISLAKQQLNGQSNCTLLPLNVHDIEELNQSFDLIYCRMVLHHLPNPKRAITQLINCLKPNGLFVCEEPPAIEQVSPYPQSIAFDKFSSLVAETFKAGNINYHIAYTMYSHLENLGLSIKLKQAFQPILNHEERKLHLMGLKDVSA